MEKRSIEFLEALTRIIIAFYARSVPYQRIELQCCIHEGLIGNSQLAEIAQCFYLGGGCDPVPDPDTFAVPAVRA